MYRLINNETQNLSCHGISEDACAQVPQNYFKTIVVNIFSQISDTIANPKTVLTWLMLALGISPAIISFIVPLRESGSMLPQIFLAEFLKNKKYRKRYWITGATLQAFSLFVIGMIGLYLDGFIAGVIIIVALVLFSFGRSWCSVVSKDIIGKTIPKSKRGKLIGYGNAISGIVVLAAGYFLINNSGTIFLSYSIIVAAVLWLLGIIIYYHLYEPAGDINPNPVSLKESLGRLSLLTTDRTLRKFVIARSLLLASALTAPFYVILAQEYDVMSVKLGLFVLATGIASIISSSFWGYFADISSRMTIVYAASISSLLGVITMILVWIYPEIQSFSLLYPIVVLILSIAHNGVRIGRKTYIVDIAEGNTRTDYVTVSNTVIGIVLLLVGVLSSVLSLVSVSIVIFSLSCIGVVGTYLSYRLPEVEK